MGAGGPSGCSERSIVLEWLVLKHLQGAAFTAPRGRVRFLHSTADCSTCLWPEDVPIIFAPLTKRKAETYLYTDQNNVQFLH